MREKQEDLVGLPDRALLMRAGNATHQHYKGGLYKLLGPVRDADTGKAVPASELGRSGGRVVYEHLYPHTREFWIRDRFEFEEILPDGTPRFRRIG
jgi:hypothetical protein